MITTRKLNEKTYEAMMEEAKKRIPLYTDEWTNFNPSDPGITILENLTSFNELQQTYIGTITAEIEEKLLQLAGFARKPGSMARVLLEGPVLGKKRLIPANQRFMLGDVSFETNHAMELCGYTITGIFADHGGRMHDYSFLTDPEVPLQVQIFGNHPEDGSHIYIVCDGLPGANEETIFYCGIAGNHFRNPFPGHDRAKGMFAVMKWECYTADGYTEIHYKDETGCFVVDGEIKFRMPRTEPAVCDEFPVKGYVLRGTLCGSHYDIPPRLVSLKGFLFEVWQKETLSICHTFNKFTEVEVVSDLLTDGYVSVFCREDKSPSYRMYRELFEEGAKGRYYVRTEGAYGRCTFSFNKKKFQYGPARVKNAVKIVVYNEFIMRRYSLGTVMGYDDQEIELPVSHLVPETFSILAERTDENGEPLYDFVKPNRMEEEALTFTVDEDAGKIVILDAGDFINARLYLCACAITRGEEGNICENNSFRSPGLGENMIFTNPGPGTGGAFRESLEEVRKRFTEDVNRPATAVTAADFEMLVRATPGLCIDKVHAYADEGRHVVNVVVKPFSEEPFARISPYYMEAIRRQTERGRLLTTRVNILQPGYVAVDVSGTVYIKPHMEADREYIEEEIRNYLDYRTSGRGFGELLRFDELFKRLESLDCVEYISELSLRPQNMNLAEMRSLDIKPMEDVLCYPGRLNLETIIYQ